jgi:hypothetical protein
MPDDLIKLLTAVTSWDWNMLIEFDIPAEAITDLMTLCDAVEKNPTWLMDVPNKTVD